MSVVSLKNLIFTNNYSLSSIFSMIKSQTLLWLLLLPLLVQAQDGLLDLTFGEGGKVVGNFAETTRFESVALQPDGKILATGLRGLELMVTRFLPDGTPDPDFGIDGFFYDQIGGSAHGFKILLQPDGKILVFGTNRVASNQFALLAMRLLPDGSDYDLDFGIEGKYINQVSGSSFAEDDILDAVLLSDGKIGIAGRSYNGQRDEVIVGRLTANGQNDPDFGEDGIRKVDLSTFSRANALVEASNGDLVIAGTTGSKNIFIARFDGNGDAVGNFGTDGFTVFNESENINNGANDMIALPNGQFLLGGNAFDFDVVDNDIALYRFDSDGSMDTNFGNNGVVKVSGSNNEAIQSLLQQPDGQILVGGSTGGFNSKFLLGRFSADGNRDLDFGNINGWSIYDIGPAANFDGVTAMVQTPDGSIIAVGSTLEENIYGYAVAKYRGTLSSLDNFNKLGIKATLYPTLISNNLVTLELDTKKSIIMNVSLANNLGQTVQRLDRDLQIEAGTTQRTWQLPVELATGTYYLLLETEGERVALPMWKM